MEQLKVIAFLLLAVGVLMVAIKILSKALDWCAARYVGLDRRPQRAIQLAFLLLVLLWPVLMGSQVYLLRTSVMVLLYVTLALSLNFILGFAGQLSMGHSAFFGIGAYITALLTVNLGLNFWAAMALSAVGAAIFGFILGMPTLRLKGDYLAIATIGFGEIVRLVLINWVSLTRGPAGIPGIPSPKLFGYTLSSNTAYYYLLLALALATIFIAHRLWHSRLGRGLIAVMDDEIAAEAMGVNCTVLKVMAFVLGAGVAGVAGSIFASFIHYVNPDNFTYMESVVILCMVVLGGVGSIPGVILGATVLTVLPEVLRDISTYRYAIYGLLLILMMIIRSQGLISVAGVRRLKGGGKC